MVEAALFGAFQPDAEHADVDVSDGDMCVMTARLRDAERHVAGSTRHIEVPERAILRRFHHAHQHVFPGPVKACGHKVVHQVVFGCDLVEDVVHHALLFAERNCRKAELRLGFVGL